MERDRAGRYEELDSLRGLAALIVVVSHHLLVFPALDTVGWARGAAWLDGLKVVPLRLLWDGGAAVWLFFVLSGFVLALPYHSGRRPAYVPYLFKRTCRIYLPYLAATCLAIVAAESVPRGELAGLSAWVNRLWTVEATPRVVLEHLALIPDVPSTDFNVVTWSLVHEMRISILFPVLMLVVGRLRGSWTIAGAVGVAMAGTVLNSVSHDTVVGYSQTLIVLLPFAVGATLCRYRDPAIRVYRQLPPSWRIGWWTVTIGLCDYVGVFPAWARVHANPMRTFFPVVGAAMLLVGVLGSESLGRLLRRRWALVLGEISYSLYLLHLIVMLTLLHVAYPRWPLAVLLPCSLVISLAASAWFHRWVERPSMALGRRLAGRWPARKPWVRQGFEGDRPGLVEGPAIG
jgi:peptidoglycan/LPS O-acetylase OafA/YrhL